MDEFPPTIAVDDTGWYQRHWKLAGYEIKPHMSNSRLRMSISERTTKFTEGQFYWRQIAQYSRGYGDKTWVRIQYRPLDQ